MTHLPTPWPKMRRLLAGILASSLAICGLATTPALAETSTPALIEAEHPAGKLVSEVPEAASLQNVCVADSPVPQSSDTSLRRAPATDTGYTDPEGTYYDHVAYSSKSRLGLGIAWTEPQIGQPTQIYVIANNLPAAASYRFDGIDLAKPGTDDSGNPAWLIEDYIMDTSQFLVPSDGPLHRDPASPKLALTFTSSDTLIITVRVGPAANASAADRFTPEYLRVAITANDPAYPSVHEKSQQLAAQAKAELGANASQYDLALWAHDWIIDHMEYDHDYGFCGAEGALTRGLGTCESYHRGLVMLLGDLGIETGRQVDDTHVWTLAKLDGTWCTIDATWDDVEYSGIQSAFPGIPDMRHLNFGLDEATTKLIHPKLEPARVPLDSLKNCYLIRSGELDFFTDYEANLIDKKLRAGTGSFTQKPRFARAGGDSRPVLGATMADPIYHLVAHELTARTWTVGTKRTNHVQVAFAPDALKVQANLGLITRDGHKEYWYDAATQAKNQWVTVGSARYYFDANGHMAYGWLALGNTRYYLGSDGAMRTGWQTVDGARYYFGSNGAMVTGWQTLDNKRYYFNGSGAMTYGWLALGNTRYYLGSDGAMRTGWQTIDGARYYFGSNGAMVTGWNTISGKRIYFNSDGTQASGWVTISGVRTYLRSDGTQASGWQLINNRWYYLTASGTPTTGWQWIGGAWYWLNADGTMATGWVYTGGAWYYLTGSGAMATGWVKDGGTWYYLTGSGAMATGWRWVGNAWYYLNGSGAMATGWQWIGGAWYWMDGSGAMASNRWIGNYYVTGSGAMATNRWIGRYHVNGAGLWDRTR